MKKILLFALPCFWCSFTENKFSTIICDGITLDFWSSLGHYYTAREASTFCGQKCGFWYLKNHFLTRHKTLVRIRERLLTQGQNTILPLTLFLPARISSSSNTITYMKKINAYSQKSNNHKATSLSQWCNWCISATCAFWQPIHCTHYWLESVPQICYYRDSRNGLSKKIEGKDGKINAF